MLKLGGFPGGWEDYVLGARVRFAPIGPKAVRRARIACAAALRVDVADIEEAGDALSRELIRRGIVEWAGIEDAKGEPLTPATLVPVFDAYGEPVLDDDQQPVMQAAVELFIADATAFEWADRVYVRPWADREREKNGWAGSPNGTSTGATPAPDTASSVAPPETGSDAAPIRKRARAGSARTSSTNRKPRRPRKSGKS
jgi:hypothetical protein